MNPVIQPEDFKVPRLIKDRQPFLNRIFDLIMDYKTRILDTPEDLKEKFSAGGKLKYDLAITALNIERFNARRCPILKLDFAPFVFPKGTRQIDKDIQTTNTNKAIDLIVKQKVDLIKATPYFIALLTPAAKILRNKLIQRLNDEEDERQRKKKQKEDDEENKKKQENEERRNKQKQLYYSTVAEELRENREVYDYVGNRTVLNPNDYTKGRVTQLLPNYRDDYFVVNQALETASWVYLNEIDNDDEIQTEFKGFKKREGLQKNAFKYVNILKEINKILDIVHHNEKTVSILIDIRYKIIGLNSSFTTSLYDIFNDIDFNHFYSTATDIDIADDTSLGDLEIKTEFEHCAIAIHLNELTLSGIRMRIIEKFADKFNSVKVIYCNSGFSVLFHEPQNFAQEFVFAQYINQLKAFDTEAAKSKAYHEQTATSTVGVTDCIYQSYHYMFKNPEILKNQQKIIKNNLGQESKEIQSAVKEGRLLDFLKLMSIKEKQELYVEFFKTLTVFEKEDAGSAGATKSIYGFKVLNETVTEITDLRDFNFRKVFSYYNDHVAPKQTTIYKDKSKKESCFCLRPGDRQGMKKFRKTNSTTAAFDIETYTDRENRAIPYLISIYANSRIFYNSDGEYRFTQSFYGENCVQDFVAWLNSKKIDFRITKTNAATKNLYLNIYGFNNACFDNAMIYLALLENGANNQKTIIAGRSIKTIELGTNIKFYDIRHYYPGTLASLAKSFKLNATKGVFPYRFPNADNLYYVGPVPELKFWNSADDRETYIKENIKEGQKVEDVVFDMKEYSIKYCELDCELTMKIAEIHREQAKFKVLLNVKTYVPNELGIIEEKIVQEERVADASNELTAAGTALGIFTQIFLENTLYANGNKLITRFERLAYKGGRTEPFRSHFNRYIPTEDGRYIDTKRILKYYDINSSYPFAMTRLMPEGEGKHEILREPETLTTPDLFDWHLYLCTASYKGTDKFYIPNLLIKRPDGTNRAMLDTPEAWHWGVELNEAIIAGCEVTITEKVTYKSAYTFKSYAEVLYNERLLVKNEYNPDGTKNPNYNKSRAEFLKLLLNSLYGKFGQNIKYTTRTYRTVAEWDADMGQSHISYRSHEILENGYIHCSFYDKTMDGNSIGQLVRFSSYIAAVARTNLAVMMRRLGYEHIYYCDTDSVFSDADAPDDLVHQSRLGGWKQEDFGLTLGKGKDKKSYSFLVSCYEANFLAPKMYSYKCRVTKLINSEGERLVQLEDDEYGLRIPYTFGLFEDERAEDVFDIHNKCKGIPQNLITTDHIDRLAAGEKDIKILNPAMFFRSVEGVSIKPQERTINRVANKRIWSGNDSFAFKNMQECNDYEADLKFIEELRVSKLSKEETNKLRSKALINYFEKLNTQ